MTGSISYRAAVALSILAIVLSILGTYSAVVLSDNTTPSQPSTAQVVHVPPQSTAAKLVFEVQTPTEAQSP